MLTSRTTSAKATGTFSFLRNSWQNPLIQTISSNKKKHKRQKRRKRTQKKKRSRRVRKRRKKTNLRTSIRELMQKLTKSHKMRTKKMVQHKQLKKLDKTKIMIKNQLKKLTQSRILTQVYQKRRGKSWHSKRSRQRSSKTSSRIKRSSRSRPRKRRIASLTTICVTSHYPTLHSTKSLAGSNSMIRL